MKANPSAIPVPVNSSMAILLRPNTSCRKKYSDKIKIIIAVRKAKIYFLLIIIGRFISLKSLIVMINYPS